MTDITSSFISCFFPHKTSSLHSHYPNRPADLCHFQSNQSLQENLCLLCEPDLPLSKSSPEPGYRPCCNYVQSRSVVRLQSCRSLALPPALTCALLLAGEVARLARTLPPREIPEGSRLRACLAGGSFRGSVFTGQENSYMPVLKVSLKTQPPPHWDSE